MDGPSDYRRRSGPIEFDAKNAAPLKNRWRMQLEKCPGLLRKSTGRHWERGRKGTGQTDLLTDDTR
jgi:hypothetical protein